ncbi:MAG TPA: hypothetical protein DCL49_04465 [Candidatus Omnitrophica bacterium]|nr:hypothetical protein [Candidatus Omnitrophota bacterium]
MIRNISIINKKGFTLIEIVVVLSILTIMTATILPREIKRIQIKAGEKTALEMAVIQEAARAYYVANNSWPASLAVLKTEGYLNSSWTTNNPWGNTYSISSSGSTFTVNTNVETEWVNLVSRDLPSATISGNMVSSTIPIPGSATNPSIPAGVILMWSGTIVSIPSGWVLCDGNNGTPDLRDKFIVGARQDSGGQAMTNISGSLTKSGGSALISIANLPSHSHGLFSASTNSAGAHSHIIEVWEGGLASPPTTLISAISYANYNTRTTSAAGAHSHTLSGNTDSTGSSAVYTQPYYTLAFIMKT